MDCYFTGDISKEDMLAMKQRYEIQTENLRERLKKAEEQLSKKETTGQMKEALKAEVESILNGEVESEMFSKTILNRLTVFKDRHMELRLKDLPQIFYFVE